MYKIKEKLQYGETEIDYTIQYSDRKTLGIVVNPDTSVLVKAPYTATKEKIELKVRKRASWILKQKYFFNSFGEKKPKRRYVNGESHLYLGRQYRLYIHKGKPSSVNFKGQCFDVVCSTKTKVEELMKDWYLYKAKEKFPVIAEPIIQKFEVYGVKPKSLYVQQMKNRWGSCTQSGKIILNTELIKAPKPCIEYVITHELCHLLHKNHTKEFYNLLQLHMPDWEKWKNKLERFMY